MDNVFAALIGAVGAIARYLFDRWVMSRTNGDFPLGTFAVNMSGALILGFLFGLLTSHLLSHAGYLILGTGLVGTYTTFSTLSFESFGLLREGQVISAIINMAGSFLAGLAMVALGYLLGVHL